jgi:two-component system sensor histidine kinase PilS (NtrC family)
MADEPNRQAAHKNSRHIGRLIVARLCMTLLVVLASALWSPHVSMTTAPNFSPDGLAALLSSRLIVIAIVILSLIYAAIWRFEWLSLIKQARAQFFADALLVTWFVWATGDLHSPYTAFYIIIISVASIFLGSRGAMIVAIGCATAYTLVMIGIVAELLPAYTSVTAAAALSAQRSIEIIGLNVIGFLVVGLLAARLAANQTRTDVQLTEATHALANLRALHERIVESIRSGVMTTDLNGCIYTFNKAAEEITGYDESEMRGRAVALLFGEDFNAHIIESLRAASEDATSPRYAHASRRNSELELPNF